MRKNSKHLSCCLCHILAISFLLCGLTSFAKTENNANSNGKASYNRIVVFPLYAEEVLLGMISPERVIYVGHESVKGGENYWPSMKMINGIPGNNWQNCDEKEIVSLCPDLLILPEYIQPIYHDVFPLLSNTDVRTLYLKEPKSIYDIYETIESLGAIVGEPHKAAQMCLEIEQHVSDFLSMFDTIDKKDIKMAYYSRDQESFSIIVNLFGLDSFHQTYGREDISDEELSQWNPDIIFFNPVLYDSDGSILSTDPSYADTIVSLITQNEFLINTNAVQHGCVFPLVIHKSQYICDNIIEVLGAIDADANGYTVTGQ